MAEIIKATPGGGAIFLVLSDLAFSFFSARRFRGTFKTEECRWAGFSESESSPKSSEFGFESESGFGFAHHWQDWYIFKSNFVSAIILNKSAIFG